MLKQAEFMGINDMCRIAVKTGRNSSIIILLAHVRKQSISFEVKHRLL